MTNSKYVIFFTSCILFLSSCGKSSGSVDDTSPGSVKNNGAAIVCDSNKTLVSNSCALTNQSRVCATQPSHSSSGTESTSDGGQTWSSCSGFACDAGYTLSGNSCVLTNQVRACVSQPANSSSGTESSSDAGQTWSSCSNFTCNASYTLIGGACVLAGQTRSCSSQPSNSTGGTEGSVDGGQTWGSCSGFTCDANYSLVSNSCVLTNQTRSCTSQPSHSTGGTESSTDGGQTWGSCSSFTCNSKYYLSGGSCLFDTFTATYTNNNTLVACDGTQNVVQSLVSCIGQNTSVSDNSECAATSNVSMQSPAGNSNSNMSNGSRQTGPGTYGPRGVITNTCSLGSSTPSLTTYSCNLPYTLNSNDCKDYVTSLNASSNDTIFSVGNYTYSMGYGYGVGTSTPYLDFTDVASQYTYESIVSQGFNHKCIAVGSNIYCKGGNSSGQLGDGTNNDSAATSKTVNHGLGVIKSITSGNNHTCATDGTTVKCWGNNGYGQLGNNSTTNSSVPVTAMTKSTFSSGDIIQVVATAQSTCATDGVSVFCWGRGSLGQIGDNSATQRNQPVKLILTMAGSIKLYAKGNADATVCASDSSSLKCWGANTNWQINSDGLQKNQPTAVTLFGLSSYSKIAIGNGHVCATDGSVLKCVGNNNNGQLGDNSNTWRTSAVTVSHNFTNPIIHLEAGEAHTCASDGASIKCWGYNGNGQLGDGSVVNKLIPTQTNSY